MIQYYGMHFVHFFIILLQLYPDETPHVTLVISPLRSLMVNQVSRWSKAGIQSAAIMHKKDMSKTTFQGTNQELHYYIQYDTLYMCTHNSDPLFKWNIYNEPSTLTNQTRTHGLPSIIIFTNIFSLYVHTLVISYSHETYIMSQAHW